MSSNNQNNFIKGTPQKRQFSKREAHSGASRQKLKERKMVSNQCGRHNQTSKR